MALFKLRKKVDEARSAAVPAESIEVMRRRARHRLIGAVVLVLAGVVGFPVLFDTQPRPVDVDIPIEIPDRNKARPLPALPQSRAPAPAPEVSGKVTPPSAPLADTPPAPVTAPPAPAPAVSEARQAPAPAPARSEPAAEKKAEVRPDAKAAEAARAQAALEGRPEPGGARYVVQVGAFAEKEKALAAQQKLERAGLKNYTNVAETKNGPRIRVRAGPFASRAEADKAVQKIKGLDLPAAVLTL